MSILLRAGKGSAPHQQRYIYSRLAQRALLTGAAVLIAAMWVVPLLWVISGSFKTQFQLIGTHPQIVSLHPTLANWTELFNPTGRGVNILQAFANSVIVSSASAGGVLVTSSLAGFAFARLRFRGRDWLFSALLLTIMIPSEVLLVPLFEQFLRMGLLDSLGALILPQLASVFGVFLMRQFMLSLPGELLESARLDGANSWQIYRHIVLPLTKPALATLAALSFLWSWNDYLWPLIAISTRDKQTLPLALITFQGAYSSEGYGTVLASVVLAITPPLVVFVIGQRFIIQGISRTGLKG